MTLEPGTRLGPYEISKTLGAGGMGVVYRARDTRLGRDVAIKVLLPELAGDEERRRRFEQEARAASALNHPNIVTIHDIGQDGATFFIAMELVEGATIREAFPAEPLPARKLLDVAVQIADGLAKAHATGIVHRDLKPENIVISRDGFVKILDFGLAKLVELPSSDTEDLLTQAGLTQPGVVMGTAGYMAPEQASGRVADFRADQFALGTILYELATGRRAFRRDTSAETLVAVIREEPEPIGRLNPRTPAPLRWIIERCLSKNPEQRYASTRDLARDLSVLRDRLSELSGETAAVTAPPTPSLPTFQRLSFRRGTILSARFAPDGRTVVYGAAWDGAPVRLFSTRPESPESSALSLPDCEILSISSTGQMAVSLERRWAGRFIWTGTLAQVPIVGGAPRELLEDVQWADWAPDGQSLAIVRSVGGKCRLEYPIGKVLHETAGWISHPRVSPNGDLVAFLDHSVQGDDAGVVCTVDRSGAMVPLGEEWITAYGLAWSPDGAEILFTATRVGVARSIWSVPAAGGAERLLLRTPAELTIQDVADDGQVLMTSDAGKVGVVGTPPGQSKERDLSLLDWSLVRGISRDGKLFLFDESGEGGGGHQGVYVRKTDGSPAVRLGDGMGGSFSPDERWVVSMTVATPKEIVLLPVKAGEPRTLTRHELSVHRPTWVPDGKRVVIAGNRPAEGLRLFVQDLEGDAPPRPITPDGIGLGSLPISPDSRFVVAQTAEQEFCKFPLDGGEAESVPGLAPEDRPIRFGFDTRFLYGFRRGEVPAQVFRLDLTSGQKDVIRELMPPDPAGVVEIVSVVITPDASCSAYSYHRILSDLFLVEGAR